MMKKLPLSPTLAFAAVMFVAGCSANGESTDQPRPPDSAPLEVIVAPASNADSVAKWLLYETDAGLTVYGLDLHAVTKTVLGVVYHSVPSGSVIEMDVTYPETASRRVELDGTGKQLDRQDINPDGFRRHWPLFADAATSPTPTAYLEAPDASGDCIDSCVEGACNVTSLVVPCLRGILVNALRTGGLSLVTVEGALISCGVGDLLSCGVPLLGCAIGCPAPSGCPTCPPGEVCQQDPASTQAYCIDPSVIACGSPGGCPSGSSCDRSTGHCQLGGSCIPCQGRSCGWDNGCGTATYCGGCGPGETCDDGIGLCYSVCASTCGNGVCECDEASTCPDDCTGQSYCGDGSCDGDEDAVSCPEDCDGGGGGCGGECGCDWWCIYYY